MSRLKESMLRQQPRRRVPGELNTSQLFMLVAAKRSNMCPTPDAACSGEARNRPAASHASSSAAYAAIDLIDLTQSELSSPNPARAVRETKPEKVVIDLTTVDNPCYDPSETGYVLNRQQEETDVPAAEEESSEQSYDDEFLDDNADSLIRLADGIEGEAAGACETVSISSDSVGSSSGSELCPVCESGRRVRTTFRRGNNTVAGFRCSDVACWYEELDD